MNVFLKGSIVGALLIGLTACWTISSGQKNGVIVKLSQDGLWVKTFEAEIVRGGFSSGTGVNGKSFHFTIENTQLAEKLKDAFENQKEVSIKYHTEALTGCTRGETDNFLDDFSVIEPKLNTN